MASIRKRGETFHITVSLGVDENYRQIRKFTTFTPPHGLTEKQAKKAAQEYARVFELNCRGLTAYDENMTLTELCGWYFENIAPNRLRAGTLESNRRLINNYILPKLGHKKLKELKPAILAPHFTELRKSGRHDIKYRVRPDYDLKEAIRAMGHTLSSFADGAMGCNELRYIIRGKNIRRATGERVTDKLRVPFDTLFEAIRENTALSPNTVKHVQLVLNAVFNAAVKAEIITSNPLINVDLPKVGELDRPVLTPEQAQLFLANLSKIDHVSAKALLITQLFTAHI